VVGGGRKSILDPEWLELRVRRGLKRHYFAGRCNAEICGGDIITAPAASGEGWERDWKRERNTTNRDP
jgi:hypothetical protein